MIFVSTGGFSKTPLLETIEQLYSAGIREIELSGGPFLEGGLSALKAALDRHPDLAASVHNYFPVPPKPFVFNLASLNSKVFETSMDHALRALDWATAIRSPWYSFHAGFLIDPDVKEIGRRIVKRELFNRVEAMEKFCEAVRELSQEARQRGIQLFIENNVLSKRNLQEFGENPLLCVTAEETFDCLDSFGGEVSLLVDVAHLKVSAHSLGFDPLHFLKKCAPITSAYHLSDNDGTRDSNEPIRKDSWFWSGLRRDVQFCTVEVYNFTPEALQQQVHLVQECFIL